MNRRGFAAKLTATLSTYLLLDAAHTTFAFSRIIRGEMDAWAKKLNSICADLKSDTISQEHWRAEIARLSNQVPLDELLTFIDFEQLKKGLELPDLGVATKTVKYPMIEGMERTVHVKKIFGMKKGRAIIPHGHDNMVSSHLILSGQFHLRQYNKVEESDRTMVIKPTVDTSIRQGNHSSISETDDNVHWFVSEADESFTFDVIVLDLHDKQYDIDNLDMEKSENIGDGLLRVPKISVEDALRKYGKQHH